MAKIALEDILPYLKLARSFRSRFHSHFKNNYHSSWYIGKTNCHLLDFHHHKTLCIQDYVFIMDSEKPFCTISLHQTSYVSWLLALNSSCDLFWSFTIVCHYKYSPEVLWPFRKFIEKNDTVVFFAYMHVYFLELSFSEG